MINIEIPKAEIRWDECDDRETQIDLKRQNYLCVLNTFETAKTEHNYMICFWTLYDHILSLIY